MELMYPIAIIICVIIAIVIFFINFKKKKKYSTGKKIANANLVKETEYYKRKVKKYNLYSNICKVLSVLCIIIASILIARPVTIVTKSEDKYNRDIFISLDVSTSECEVNYELVKKFKEIIPDIEGDRIGIVIFNTCPIVFCPLTDDYNFVMEKLDIIERQVKILLDNGGEFPDLDYDKKEDGETVSFWTGGVITGSRERGSSLIGDGLARNNFFIS